MPLVPMFSIINIPKVYVPHPQPSSQTRRSLELHVEHTLALHCGGQHGQRRRDPLQFHGLLSQHRRTLHRRLLRGIRLRRRAALKPGHDWRGVRRVNAVADSRAGQGDRRAVRDSLANGQGGWGGGLRWGMLCDDESVPVLLPPSTLPHAYAQLRRHER
jgi:hypothetical protein